MISAINPLTGCERCLRKTSLSLRSNAVRFLPFGVRNGIHRPRRLRTRRNSNPRNPKLSPCVRSTLRLFSSFTSTSSLANSSRSRLLHRLPKPLPWRGCRVHQNHQIIGESGVLDHRPSLPAGDFFRPLQHLVHFIQVQVTEQRRNHPALRNTLLPRRLQNQFEEPQNLIIAHSPGHLLQHDMMPYRVKVASQIKVDDVGLALDDRFCNALDAQRALSSSAGSQTTPVESPPRRSAPGSSFSAPWTTRSRIDGIESWRNFFPPSFGISTFRARWGR